MTRDELITAKLPLVNKIAGRIVKRLPRFVEAEELRSDGFVGLVHAADTFRPDRGTTFRGWASACITRAIIDGLRSRRWTKFRESRGAKVVRADTRAKASARQVSMTGSRMLERSARGVAAKDRPPWYDVEQADAIRHLTRKLGREERFIVLSACVHDLDREEIGRAVGLGRRRTNEICVQALAKLRAQVPAMLERTSQG